MPFGGDAAGFKAGDGPMAVGIADVDVGVAIFTVEGGIVAGAVKLGKRGDDGGLAEDAYLLVRECELGDVKRSGANGGEGVIASLERAVCADANVVGVEQGTESVDVLTEKRGAPLLFELEDGVTKMMALGARHGLYSQNRGHHKKDGQQSKRTKEKSYSQATHGKENASARRGLR